MLAVGTPFPHFARRPVFGAPVDTATITASRPLLVVTLRHAGSALTRAASVALDGELDRLDREGIAVVALVEGTLAEARDLVPRQRLRYRVVRDDGGLYAALGVGRDRGLLRTALNPASAVAWARALATNGHGARGGPLDRVLAAVLVAPGGVVAWAWQGAGIADLPPLGEVKRA